MTSRSASATTRPTVFSVCDGCGHIGTECERVTIASRDGSPFPAIIQREGDSAERMSVLYCVDCLWMASGPFGQACGAAAEPEVYVVGRTPMPSVEDVVRFLGGRREETGGGCSAFVFDHGDSETIITDGDYAAPLDLRESAEAWTGLKSERDEPDSGDGYTASLAVILWDLYGAMEGAPVPAILADVRRIASEG